MSTYTIPVSGPSPRLAFLRALAVKTLARTSQLLATIRVTLTRSTQLVRSAASAALAVIGSDAGYQVIRHSTRTTITAIAAIANSGARLVGRALGWIGRTALQSVVLVSPTAACKTRDAITARVLTPVTRAFTAMRSWGSNVSRVLWDLSDYSVVRSVTIRAAQAAGLVLAIHMLSQGAVASRIVQALPWVVDAVIWATNPVKALALVMGAFTTALTFAAVRLLSRPATTDPERTTTRDEPLVDQGTPALIAGRRDATLDTCDLGRVAASINVEVAPDGSVLVHGVPTDLPADVALEVARVAAEAATARLEKVLLHRPIPNRDDRRLLTKVAREAIRRGTPHPVPA